mgnify:CR=1 FL=1
MRHVLLVFIMFLMSNMLLAHEIKITDLYNREVLIPEKVERVLALGAGSLRLLVYAGAQELIVGRELFEEKIDKSLRPYTYNLPDNYNKLPIVSAGGPEVMPDVEAIKDVKPDLIFVSALKEDQVEKLSWLTGIPIIGLTYGDIGHTDLEKIKESIRLIGYATHTQKRTQFLLNKMAMLRKDIFERSYKQERRSVFMAAISYRGERQFASTERAHPSCNMLNIHNIADDINIEINKPTHTILSMAYIINKQPDYIFYDITGVDELTKNYNNLFSVLYKVEAV